MKDGLADEKLLVTQHGQRSLPVKVNRADARTAEGENRVLWSLTDLTSRIRAEARQIEAAEAAREANAAKSRFLAAMSHELRTPMNAIIGYGELMLEDLGEPEMADDMKRILGSASHLLRLIDDVLDISRIEAGRLPLEVQGYALGDVFRSIVVIARPQLLERGVRFEYDVPSDLGSASTDLRHTRDELSGAENRESRVTGTRPTRTRTTHTAS